MGDQRTRWLYVTLRATATTAPLNMARAAPRVLVALAALASRAGAQAAGVDTTRADTTRADPAPAYATPALRALVARAALGNRVPPSLASYRAQVETEFAVAVRREGGVEAVVTVEQLASVLRWTRAGYYDQHVVGDRVRQAGFGLSWLSFARTGWAAPVLYGNRFRVRREAGGTRPRGGARQGRAADTLPIIHPLAADRDRYYRYTGGDTAVTLRVGGRRLSIVRLLVEPRADAPAAGAALFRGEVDLDATEHAVVRMRGRVLAGRAPRRGGVGAAALRTLARAVLPQGYAYLEYVNAERADVRGRRYWLPAYQRIEGQVESPALGGSGAVARIVSRFTDVAVNDTALTPAELAADADSLLVAAPRRLTLARGDSLGRYGAWREGLGDATADARASDFADLAPRALAPAGPPRADVFVPRASDLVRVTRVDGVFVGAGGRVRFRDRAPGLTLLATAGVGTASGQVRGRVELERQLGPAADADDGSLGGALGGALGTTAPGARWTLALRAGRSLDLTNDFRAPLDSGSSLGALLGVDDYDYVDRRVAGLALARASGGRALLARLEAGVASDRGERAVLTRGPLVGGNFRPNRGVDAGRYLRTALTVEWHPDVAGEFVRPGLGARFYAERGDAAFGGPGLRYTRLEGRLTGRRELLAGTAGGALGGSTLALAARGDVGAVLGGPNGPPPQQLFELGYAQNLLGYGYKTFAGDRAATARGLVQFTGPFLRTPVRLPLRPVRRFVLPGLAPGVALGAQLGWAEASNAGARASIARLGMDAGPIGALVPVSRPTGGVRASVSAGATLFGGGMFIGAARAVDGHRDAPRRWRAVVTFGVGL